MTRRRKLSRREFLTLIAAGSAATAAAPIGALAATARAARKTSAPAPPPPSPRIAREIEKQKRSTDDALKVIRGYALPPGSDMAFVFQPVRAKRKRGL
ncbi:MAG: hypothetical protein HY076_06995 [Candidatus Eisenbacteria bacterium]|uniref:Twin-arginine translocation signal domain-containing protein n=1 Tax=Eiseniibacteriota bacterium TaxID=2212470 RepID=A0A9D6LAR1_UNCEI|nr:hypothetical protein [Candidatus Eisenbacteria bacterium]MBI3540002.1 hypothetical protein [Candidatus Eisenbacteria bacterium]